MHRHAQNHSPEHQMGINLLLKIVPNKCTISSCLIKNYSDQLLKEITEPFIYFLRYDAIYLWGVF